MHHPSSLGNKILAEVFMCVLARNKPFMDFEAGTPCVPFTAWNWDDELRQNFSAWDVRAHFGMYFRPPSYRRTVRIFTVTRIRGYPN